MPGVRGYWDFMDRIVIDWTTGCHLWKGTKVCIGYGRLSYKGKSVLAHRLAKYLYGDVSETVFRNSKQIFMHECDKPSCINPLHITVGTQKENVHDCMNKNRRRKYDQKRNILGKYN